MKLSIELAGCDPVDQRAVEFVERKGIGHPDTLCDGIAEKFSIEYSKYSLNIFGKIANHWVDKCMLIGGESEISFGKGKIIKPIQIYIVGKVTEYIGNSKIPIFDIAVESTMKYLKNVFPHIEKNDVNIILNINSAIGAGRPNFWYRPTSINDIYDSSCARSNDASICVGYAPLSLLENLVLNLEMHLNSANFKSINPETGTDIKLLAYRINKNVRLTACIPFISFRTPSRIYYNQKKDYLKEYIINYCKKYFPTIDLDVYLNTRDDDYNIYMTYLGSAADTGDVGVVGRGNRQNGLISPTREMSIEAPCGKNPIYHAGKLYSAFAQQLSQNIFNTLQVENYVNISSQTGDPLNKPSHIAIKLTKLATKYEQEKILQIVNDGLINFHEITNHIIEGTIRLF